MTVGAHFPVQTIFFSHWLIENRQHCTQIQFTRIMSTCIFNTDEEINQHLNAKIRFVNDILHCVANPDTSSSVDELLQEQLR